ncbi:MAG TPA: LPS export ABC transporter periplasmic protein LptC [Gallionella sp.]|nr:LPS export ABC transporter periplasmic protein LptC [Gallionella sp.]
MTFLSRARYWLPLLPLLGLLGFTYWLNQLARKEPVKPDVSKRHDPDAIIENFSATRLNAQGSPHFIVAAKKMIHYSDDDSTVLEVPHLTSMSAERPAIHAIAKRGIVSSKGDEVFLHEDVEVLREASALHNELRIHTEYLHLIPDQDLADTDRAVTITEAHNTVQATGLKMDNRARTLKLLAMVKSEYASNNK